MNKRSVSVLSTAAKVLLAFAFVSARRSGQDRIVKSTNSQLRRFTMSHSSRIILFVAIAAAAVLVPTQMGAQVTIKPAPPGTLITVNNGPGDSTDPHVSGNLVSYSSCTPCSPPPSAPNSTFTVHYFDLSTRSDNAVPNDGTTLDFLSDVNGNTIAFTRLSTTKSAIFTYAVGAPSVVEVAPAPGVTRQAAQVASQIIVWQDFSFGSGASSDIVVYDAVTGTTTRLANDSAINVEPAVSPDGTTVAWAKCQGPIDPFVDTGCDIWSATRQATGWQTHQLTNANGNCLNPDSNGEILAYSCNRGGKTSVYWQPVAGGAEQTLGVLADEHYPSVAGPFIALAGATSCPIPSACSSHDIYVLDRSAATLYQITNTPDNKQLNDISVTPDGQVNVVWQAAQGQLNVFAYSFKAPAGDFDLSASFPMSVVAGSSASGMVTVNSVFPGFFHSTVNLAVSGQPAGVMASVVPNLVLPSFPNPTTSVLNVSVPSFITPTNFTLTVTGTSGSLTHSATAAVTVTVTASSVANLIGDLLSAGCIDNAGIGNALTSKLSAAQSAGNVQAEINTLTALKNQINAQTGKHIATSCVTGGVAFNPVAVLLADVQALIDSLRTSMIPDPITGYVVDSSGMGVAGAAVSILDASGSTVIVTATTDITGFYFFPTTGVLIPGSTMYTIEVTGFPAGFSMSTPPSQTFMWAGTGLTFNFSLN